jgi:hypothetical protein
VLPDISNYVVELAGFEEVYWVWWEPILEIYIAYLTVVPVKVIFMK